MIEHPNFIQVPVEEELDGGFVAYYSAVRNPLIESDHDFINGSWEIQNGGGIYDLQDIWGLRLVLDEIERRIIAEEEK